MARLVGLDIRKAHIRAAVVRTSYRKVTLEVLRDIDVSAVATTEDAVRAVALGLAQHGESLAVAVDGEQAFIHRLRLPKTALKQIDEVLPFEVEAAIPVDIDELVYDHRLLAADAAAQARTALVGAARTESVRSIVDLVRTAVGREPERVGCGPLPLANLASVCPRLAVPGPVAIVDLGGQLTEVVVLQDGVPAFGRTLSRGVEGLPASAPLLAAALRQTFAAWASAGGGPPVAAYLVGGGASAPGAAAYLSSELGIAVEVLFQLDVELPDPALADHIPRYAKAIALALSLASRPRDLDLRRGPLAFQRGFGFIKERAPVLSGLAAAIAISFSFATWAEYRALATEQQALSTALGSLASEVLGEETTDAGRVLEILETGSVLGDADPMPHMDGFDVMVEISKAVPASITHDIEELDLQRGHVKLHGVAGTTDDAQTVAGALKPHACVKDLKISKITKAIDSDRQKYVMEFDLACPEDEKGKKKKKKADAKAKEGE